MRVLLQEILFPFFTCTNWKKKKREKKKTLPFWRSARVFYFIFFRLSTCIQNCCLFLHNSPIISSSPFTRGKLSLVLSFQGTILVEYWGCSSPKYFSLFVGSRCLSYISMPFGPRHVLYVLFQVLLFFLVFFQTLNPSAGLQAEVSFKVKEKQGAHY